jgi:hypothetical protein
MISSATARACKLIVATAIPSLLLPRSGESKADEMTGVPWELTMGSEPGINYLEVSPREPWIRNRDLKRPDRGTTDLPRLGHSAALQTPGEECYEGLFIVHISRSQGSSTGVGKALRRARYDVVMMEEYVARDELVEIACQGEVLGAKFGIIFGYRFGYTHQFGLFAPYCGTNPARHWWS